MERYRQQVFAQGLFPKEEFDEILRLFYQTVHQVNAADYTAPQLDAWAPREPDLPRWEQKLTRQWVLTLWDGPRLAGFASLESPWGEEDMGCLDLLYVNRECQRRGVGSLLACRVEQEAARRGLGVLRTEASLTARGFFARRGYRELYRQQVPLRGQNLTNFVMEKRGEGPLAP